MSTIVLTTNLSKTLGHTTLKNDGDLLCAMLALYVRNNDEVTVYGTYAHKQLKWLQIPVSYSHDGILICEALDTPFEVQLLMEILDQPQALTLTPNYNEKKITGAEPHDDLTLIRRSNTVYWEITGYNEVMVQRQIGWMQTHGKQLRAYHEDLCSKHNILQEDQRAFDQAKYISASSLRNYMINDCYADLVRYSSSGGLQFSSQQQTLFDRGNEFENEVVQELLKQHSEHMIKITDSINAGSVRYYQETMLAMIQGWPIIYQAIVHDQDNMRYGAVDLLVRSDWLNTIVKTRVISDEDAVNGCRLSDTWHYRVIDIKLSKSTLCADGVHMVNQLSVKATKAQLFVYTCAVGCMQGYVCPVTYVLGNGWRYTKKGNKHRCSDYFDRLAHVDFDGVDGDLVAVIKKADAWVRDARANAHTWDSRQPHCEKLYPNMKKWSADVETRALKNSLAQSLAEITAIWMCGVKQRKMAFAADIQAWSDVRLTAAVMGLKGNRGKIVDNILVVNRSDDLTHLPALIASSALPKLACITFFVKFETLNICNKFIYMIGVSVLHNDEFVEYKCFTVSTTSLSEELRNMQEFAEYIQVTCTANDTSSFIIYHWSQFERALLTSFLERHEITEDVPVLNNNCWSSLVSVFHGQTLAIHGALKFGLREIYIALCKNSLVELSKPLPVETRQIVNADTNAVRRTQTNGSRCAMVITVYQFLRAISNSEDDDMDSLISAFDCANMNETTCEAKYDEIYTDSDSDEMNASDVDELNVSGFIGSDDASSDSDDASSDSEYVESDDDVQMGGPVPLASNDDALGSCVVAGLRRSSRIRNTRKQNAPRGLKWAQ